MELISRIELVPSESEKTHVICIGLLGPEIVICGINFSFLLHRFIWTLMVTYIGLLELL